MRVTVPASSLATHSAPAPAAIALGFAPTRIGRADAAAVEVDALDPPVDAGRHPHRTRRGGQRARRVADLEPPHDLVRCPGRPAPPRASRCRPPTASRRRTPARRGCRRPGSSRPRSRSRSIRETVPSAALAIQTDPPPPTTALGLLPTPYCAVIRPLSGSISPTAFSPMPGRPSGSRTRITPYAVRPATTRTAAATSTQRRAACAAAAAARSPAPPRPPRARRARGRGRGSRPAAAAARSPGSTPICSTSAERASR